MYCLSVIFIEHFKDASQPQHFIK